MKKTILVVVILIVGAVFYFYFQNNSIDTKKNDIITADEREILDIYKEKIIGTWESVEDEKYILLFEESGSFSDTYDSEFIGSGSWELEEVFGEFDVTFYLHKELDGEEYDYEVLNIDDNNLVLLYLGRGNILEYVKLNN